MLLARIRSSWTRIRPILSRLIVALVLMFFGAVIGFALRPDSGAHVLARDGGEWGALATTLAAVVALWFGLRDGKARSRELDRLVEERDEARRTRDADLARDALAQRQRYANDVVVWATKHAVKRDGRWDPELSVGFTNASPLPISMAHLVLEYPGGPKEVGAVGMVVEAGATSPTFIFRADQMDDLPGRKQIVLHFIDGAGVRWSKTAGGVLTEDTDSPELQGGQKPGHLFKFIGRDTNMPFDVVTPGRTVRLGPGNP